MSDYTAAQKRRVLALKEVQVRGCRAKVLGQKRGGRTMKVLSLKKVQVRGCRADGFERAGSRHLGGSPASMRRCGREAARLLIRRLACRREADVFWLSGAKGLRCIAGR